MYFIFKNKPTCTFPVVYVRAKVYFALNKYATFCASSKINIHSTMVHMYSVLPLYKLCFIESILMLTCSQQSTYTLGSANVIRKHLCYHNETIPATLQRSQSTTSTMHGSYRLQVLQDTYTTLYRNTKTFAIFLHIHFKHYPSMSHYQVDIELCLYILCMYYFKNT